MALTKQTENAEDVGKIWLDIQVNSFLRLNHSKKGREDVGNREASENY